MDDRLRLILSDLEVAGEGIGLADPADTLAQDDDVKELEKRVATVIDSVKRLVDYVAEQSI